MELEKEVNQLIDDIIVEYENNDYYKKEKRSVMLLGILNAVFENTFEKHLEEGNKIYRFFKNNQTHKKIVEKIAKNRKYDLNYLESIYDDLLCGISMNYNFESNDNLEQEDDKQEKKKKIIVVIFATILAILIEVIKIAVSIVLVPIVFLISFFIHKE